MLIFAWLLVRGFAALVLSILDDLIVIARLKWRPAMGRARWRWSRSEPDNLLRN